MKKHIHFKFAVLAAAAILLPIHAFAATVYLQSSRTAVSVGDTVIVTAKIDAQGTSINTVQGDIGITSGASDMVVQEFSLGGSAFGLWPRTPSLSADGTTVSFTGGVPGGFNIEGATLFKIIYQAKKAGTVTIAPENMMVFANDGNATKLPVQTQDVTINVAPAATGTVPVDDWSAVVSQDTTPPEPFIIVLGQDPSIYSGQKFAFFSAVDNQSGISYYDVSEDGAPAVKSGSTYVLEHQSGPVQLVVTAYDKAGNKTVAVYPSAAQPKNVSWNSIIFTALALILIIVIALLLYRKSKKAKNNASPSA